MRCDRRVIRGRRALAVRGQGLGRRRRGRDGGLPPFDPPCIPGAPDKPDLAFEDTNCDGIDGDLSNAIFVDGGGGLDAAPGTGLPQEDDHQRPRGGQGHRQGRLRRRRHLRRVARTGPNIGIYGGFTPNFAARSTTEPTTINGGPQAALADGDAGVVLQLLTLPGRRRGPGGSSYGLRIINNAKVAVQRVTAIGGTAGAGAVGTTGTHRPHRW